MLSLKLTSSIGSSMVAGEKESRHEGGFEIYQKTHILIAFQILTCFPSWVGLQNIIWVTTQTAQKEVRSGPLTSSSQRSSADSSPTIVEPARSSLDSSSAAPIDEPANRAHNWAYQILRLPPLTRANQAHQIRRTQVYWEGFNL
ncbi:hypothetical protein TorRG33x02_040950 [Trema orientale]|uniref:Uncharacterized protein n=1 Tax=Trema orientale TaxID=63057 RepID=A0A2P5FR86_TREOI|nr:hypothetical protein TorRG33x02_040950 [Trema orientale]